MLDMKFLRENIDLVKEKVASKNVNIDFDQIIALDEERKAILFEVEQLKAERNKSSKMIGEMKKAGKDAKDAILKTGNIGSKIASFDKDLSLVETNLRNLLMTIPNLPQDSVPIGKDAEANVVVRSWGEQQKFGFIPKDHLSLCKDLELIDFEKASKMSGSGFPLYTGKGATLERALINYMLDFHIQDGFVEVIPPILARAEAMEGTSQLPKLEEDMYFIDKDGLYLIPTGEVTITNMHRESMLSENQLPLSYVGYTPCFRREAGSYGKDTRGLLRLHQFNKVEMVKFVVPETSKVELESLVERVESILKNLQIHYRVLELCSGDLSFGAAKCYDIETWSVAEEKYLEASSCSNFEDFQSRRMRTSYRTNKGKKRLVHTLNGSGIATSRLMVSILENNQNEDGSITVPEVLRKYTGFDIIN